MEGSSLVCLTAFPEHLNSQEEIEANFPDDSQYGDTWYGRLYRRWSKFIKPHIVFGPRDIHWYHRFREWPITLLALFGEGQARFENDILAIKSLAKPIIWYDSSFNKFYLSRIQYWTKWHIQIQWPLFLGFSFYRNDQFWMGYLGFKRDADKIYILGAFFGKGAK